MGSLAVKFCSVEGCPKKSIARGFCQKHYDKAKRRGDFTPNPYGRDGFGRRFWRKVNKNGPNHPILGTQCWVWTASTNANGYGTISQFRGPARKQVRAHRASWALHFGEIPDELCVLHRCDNPSCIRPEHLFLGTVLENSQDMIRKGRDNHDPSRYLRGEQRRDAKLTVETVKECRISVASGAATIPELARKNGVSCAAMRQAVHRRTWKHVV